MNAQSCNFLFPGRSCCGILLATGLLYCQALLAQGAVNSHHGYPLALTSLVADTLTVPADDAVLDRAPNRLQLQFPALVRLVKLTLHNDAHDWVDIHFRYSPRPIEEFSLALPSLQSATFYTADWAVLGENDQLIRGSFSFAFGPDAESPSMVRAARERILEQRLGNDDPDVRTVNPPPTRIIINEEPRTFDPPFTIILDDAVDDLN